MTKIKIMSKRNPKQDPKREMARVEQPGMGETDRWLTHCQRVAKLKPNPQGIKWDKTNWVTNESAHVKHELTAMRKQVW